MKFATKPIRHYPPHLRHVATLPWEIKNSILCRYSAGMEDNANKLLFIASNFVIHSQILISSAFEIASFPHVDCKWNFPCHCCFTCLLLQSICDSLN